MNWYKIAQLSDEIYNKYSALITKFLSLPSSKQWGYDKAPTDKERAVGACGTVSKDLAEFLTREGSESHLLGCTGFVPDLPDDAHEEWKGFIEGDRKKQQFLWHAVVETEDAILDLTGGQYGEIFSGIQIKPKEEYLKNWESSKPWKPSW
jgi:hypothetical protein